MRSRDEPFVLFPRSIGPGLYDQIVGLCRAAGFSPNVVYESGATATMVAMVEAGVGVSVLPASHAGTGSARFVPLSGGDFQTEHRARLGQRQRVADRRAPCARPRGASLGG